MLTDEQAQWIALFYLLALMDERLALQAAHKTVAQLKAAGSGRTGETDRVTLIRSMTENLATYRKLSNRAKPGVFPDSAWKLPDHFEIAPWSRFQKSSSENEIVAVILSRVLSFTDHEIAEGLHVTLGTARYRIGKGIRQLAGQFESVSRRASI